MTVTLKFELEDSTDAQLLLIAYQLIAEENTALGSDVAWFLDEIAVGATAALLDAGGLLEPPIVAAFVAAVQARTQAREAGLDGYEYG